MPGVRSTAQLQCIYTNARSMGNKQEELEAIAQQDSYDLVAITEMWWDSSHDWQAVMDGYRLFRKDRPTSKWKKSRLSGVVSMDSPRGNHA